MMRRTAFALLLAAALPAAADETCLGCHGGDGLVAATQAASKHGVIARLQPGSGRAPGCSDCHPVTPAHADMPRVPAWRLAPDALRTRLAPMAPRCGRCHAPRFVDRQLDAAARGLAVGVAKRQEAEAVLAAARREAPALQPRLEALATQMARHLDALWLGHAHGSPDHQWWHGQAALDGDLIRIKGTLAESRRQR